VIPLHNTARLHLRLTFAALLLRLHNRCCVAASPHHWLHKHSSRFRRCQALYPCQSERRRRAPVCAGGSASLNPLAMPRLPELCLKSCHRHVKPSGWGWPGGSGHWQHWRHCLSSDGFDWPWHSLPGWQRRHDLNFKLKLAGGRATAFCAGETANVALLARA
jgi:hypothetical protein